MSVLVVSPVTGAADGRVTPGGTTDIAADDMPVFIPQQVFDDAMALTRRMVGRETGGFLVGHLCRDPGSDDLFARVAAQLPARHTVPTETRLTFTPQTWDDMHDGLALRGDDELLLGWWHSHPVRAWCANCPTDRQVVCHLARDFFSRHDRALHRTVFPRAYSVALVVNDIAFEDPDAVAVRLEARRHRFPRVLGDLVAHGHEYSRFMTRTTR